MALYRAECGLTQEQLADAAGVSRDTIRRAEADEPSRPWALSRRRIANKLAELLGKDAAELAQEIWP